MNIKRAFKTMQKHGDGYSYYTQIKTGKYIVSNGHVVVTVSEADFEANKQYLKNLREVSDVLLKVARDMKTYDTEAARLTTVSILCGDKQTRVIKSEHGLCVVNTAYIEVLQDVGCSMYFETPTPVNGQIKTPLVECVVGEDDEVYHLNAVLPINTNVKEVLERVIS